MARSKNSSSNRRRSGSGRRANRRHSSKSSDYLDVYDEAASENVEQLLEKPRRYQTPYTAFVKASWAAVRAANPELKFSKATFKEHGASIVSKWKAMSEEEKAPFEEESALQRARYQELMVAYKAQQLELKKSAPKRPLSSYMLFTADEREKVREELGGAAAKVVDIAKELGRRWAALEPARKEEYKAKAAQARAEYYGVAAEEDQEGEYLEVESVDSAGYTSSEDEELSDKDSRGSGTGRYLDSYSYSSGESSEFSEDDDY